jgi:ATP-dependent helicase/nuclease subunit A
LPSWATSPAPPDEGRPRFIRPSLALGEMPSARNAPRRGSHFTRGLLVHALLARLPDIAREDRVRVAQRYLAAREFGRAEAETLIAETLAIIDSPDFAAAFAPGSRAEADVVADLPELGKHARVNGRIDRLAVTDDEVLAVDFKSNRPAPKDVGGVAPLYLAQMALYRAALEKIFPGRTARCALIWTEVPRLMPLPAELLDATLGGIAMRLDRPGSGS